MLIDNTNPGVVAFLDEGLRFAAEELAKYLSKCFGAKFAVSGDAASPKGSNYFILGLLDDAEIAEILAARGVDAQALKNDENRESFAVIVDDGQIIICGDRPRSVLYGVYDFLEKEIGCCFAISADGIEHTPNLDELKLRKSRRTETAAFPVRGLGFHTDDNVDVDLYRSMIDWLTKLKYNRIQINLKLWDAISAEIAPFIKQRDLDLDLGVHSLAFFLPPDKYMESHPEWYADVDSRFGRQLKFSNLDSVPTAVANIIEYLNKIPNVKYLGVWPLDGTGFDPAEIATGEMGDIVLAYANAVAEGVSKEFPDLIFDHLAYVGYVRPPSKTKPLSSIMTSVCHYWDREFTKPICDYHHGRANNASEWSKRRALENFSPLRSHRQCCDDLKGWIKLGDAIVFTYYPDLNLTQHNVFDVWDVIRQDMRYYRAIGAKGTLACYCMHKEFAWIYREINAMGRFQWNPDANSAKLNVKVLNAVFGGNEVADEIGKFYDSLHSLHDKPLYGGFTPADLLRGILPTYDLAGYDIALHSANLTLFDERWTRSERFLCRAFEHSASGAPEWRIIEELMFNLLAQRVFFRLGCCVLCALGHRALAAKGEMDPAKADVEAKRLCAKAVKILDEFAAEFAERIGKSKGLKRKIEQHYRPALEKDFPTMEAPL